MPSFDQKIALVAIVEETTLTHITDQIHLFDDTCNVYLLCAGHEAVLIDLGSGDVLDYLAEIGVDRVTDVLVTHHHRDQRQGLLTQPHLSLANKFTSNLNPGEHLENTYTSHDRQRPH